MSQRKWMVGEGGLARKLRIRVWQLSRGQMELNKEGVDSRAERDHEEKTAKSKAVSVWNWEKMRLAEMKAVSERNKCWG